MKIDKLADGSKDILSPEVIKAALQQASISDLLNEAFQSGLTVEARQEPTPGFDDERESDRRMRQWDTLRRRKLQERRWRLRERQETGASDINEAIASLEASGAKHRRYVGQLFELLRRKRIEKKRALGLYRADATPEFAQIGSRMARVIFNHLVIARWDALDAGTCDIESLYEFFIGATGRRFADGMVKGDYGIPPDLWATFIYRAVGEAAASFSDIVEEGMEGMRSEDDECDDKKPDFIN